MSGETKQLLREAREAIGAQRHAAAAELCRRALQAEPASYMALVLLGVALQQDAGAEQAFRRALHQDSTKPLAWQGLATFYEKNDGPDACDKLMSTYEDMLRLGLESTKLLEIVAKLGQHWQRAPGRAVRMLDELARGSDDPQVRLAADHQLLALLATEAACFTDNDLLVSLERILQQHPKQENIAINYAKLISKNLDLKEFIENVRKLEVFSTSKRLREFVCRHVFDVYTNRGTLEGLELATCSADMTRNLDPASCSLLRCVELVEGARHKEAYELAATLMDPHNVDDTIALFLVKCSISLHNWRATEIFINTVLTKIKKLSSATALKKHLLMCQVKLKRWRHGARVGRELVAAGAADARDRHLLAQCLIRERQDDTELLDSLRTTEWYDSLVALRHMMNDQLLEAQRVLEDSSSNTSDKWLYLGIVYWKLNQRDKALVPLLKATKLDPGDATSFLYLGHYYNEHIGNLDKAKKCYLKAYSLDEECSEVMVSLSGLYRATGDAEAEYEVVGRACAAGGEPWARLRLGLLELTRRRWDAAVRSLRAVVRARPDDSLAWAGLADAYCGRRSFTSALKCYARLADLAPRNDVYARTQMATVTRHLGLTEEALVGYEDVLADEPEYPLALKGIADTLKIIADEMLEQGRFARSRESVQRAVEYAVRAVVVSPNFMCLWKLLGDLLILFTKYPPKYAYAHVPAALVGENDKESVYKMKVDIFPLAIACYSRAIKISTFDRTPLYYDVSVAYRALYLETGDVEHCRKAFSIAQHCAEKKPGEWQYWNLLGVLGASEAIQNTKLAQCCFLKALACNKASPEAWTNLGVLYLQAKKYRVANKTFKRAQEDEPDYICSWVGQGLIAEAVRENEAMDLFRHAAQLGTHRQATLGYAHWVCCTLRDRRTLPADVYRYAIETVGAVPTALDLVGRACAFHPRDPAATTLLGLLQEHAGLARRASVSHALALEASTTQERRNAAAVNLGRALLRSGAAEDALRELQQVTEASLGSACLTALALARTERLDEAQDALDTALQWLAEGDRDRADLLVAAAGLAYRLSGADEAKTLLFQSIKAAATPTPHSLFATCALGLLQADLGLARLALSELGRCEERAAHAAHEALLTACLLAADGRPPEAVRALDAAAWRVALQLCSRYDMLHEEVARETVERALVTDGPPAAELLSAASLQARARGEERALRLAVQAVRAEPHGAAGWAALLASARCGGGGPGAEWLRGVAGAARRRLRLSRPLGLWFGLVERSFETAIEA